MAVHFKFAAFKQYDSVPMVGESISLAELKDEIATLKFRAALEGTRRMKEAFDFRVYDAETKEEILGAHTKVRKHSCVLVKRVPAFVVSQQQQVAPAQRNGIQELSRPQEDVIDDGFGDDVFSTPSVSNLSSERNSSGNPETSILTAIESPEEAQKIEVVSANRIVRPEVVENRKVVTAVKKNVISERVVNLNLASAKVPCKIEIPLELTCSLCHDIMKDPVLIPCCCNSFCRNCVKLEFVEQQKCPACGLSKCRESDLLPNRHLKTMIDCFLESNGSASNLVSSNGSCSSQSLVSSISSEIGQEITPHKKALDGKTSIASNVSKSLPSVAKNINLDSYMAHGSNVGGKRKPLTISLIGAKKARC